MHSFAPFFVVYLTCAEAATLRRLYQWPNNTAASNLENIAIRPCGELIITTTSEPCIYTLDPCERSPMSEKIHCFDNGTATTGIAEIRPDVFAVHVGTIHGFEGVVGSFSVWTMDFNRQRGPVVRKLTAIPEAGTLNGMTAVPGQNFILSADSTFGRVYKVDTRTAKYAIAGQDPHFLSSSEIPFGLNGIHIDPSGTQIYFSNTANGTFGTTPFNHKTDTFTDFHTIAHADPGKAFDDFEIDWHSSTAYITEHPNRISRIDLNTGDKEIVVDGPQGDVGPFEPTAVALSGDACGLYVVANEYMDAETGEKSNGQVFEVGLC